MSDQRSVHFASYGDWTACDEYTPYSGLAVTRERDQVTCPRCRARFTNPTDAELVIDLLAERRRWIRGEL